MKKLIDRTTVRYVEIGVLNMLFCTAIMYLLYNLTPSVSSSATPRSGRAK